MALGLGLDPELFLDAHRLIGSTCLGNRVVEGRVSPFLLCFAIVLIVTLVHNPQNRANVEDA